MQDKLSGSVQNTIHALPTEAYMENYKICQYGQFYTGMHLHLVWTSFVQLGSILKQNSNDLFLENNTV